MTLQSSGPISLSDVQTEFGGSNPIGINEYYGVAAGVPASGTISLNDFYGKSSIPPITWTNSPHTLGYSYTEGYVSSSSFTGNTVTPGAPTRFYIILNVSNGDGGEVSLRLYVGGSLYNTWTTTSNYSQANYIPTIGSSSIRFDSTLYDGNPYIHDNYYVLKPSVTIYASYASANVIGVDVYSHSHDNISLGYRD